MKLPAQNLLLAAAVVALAAAVPASAQDTPAAPAADAPAATPEAAPETAPSTETPAPAAPATPAPTATGTADPAAPEVMEVVRATFGDWEVRCAPAGNECFMYQLAKDAGQNPVAEVSILKLPAQAEATPGGYYGPTGFMEMKGQPGRAEIRPQARDAETARRLWSLSEQMTGVAFG